MTRFLHLTLIAPCPGPAHVVGVDVEGEFMKNDKFARAVQEIKSAAFALTLEDRRSHLSNAEEHELDRILDSLTELTDELTELTGDPEDIQGDDEYDSDDLPDDGEGGEW